MQEQKFWRTVMAGVIAWIVFTIILYMVPAMGVPKMDLPALLGGMFGMNSVAMGWVMHFIVGMVLAFVYAYWLVEYLPGAPWLRGLEYGVLPWLTMMVIVAPMLPVVDPMTAKMPPGFFLANMGTMATVGSLIAHLIWGVVLGAVSGDAGVTHREAARA
jgi:uncharacterized membrane protein YagU involved in acid resistance